MFVSLLLVLPLFSPSIVAHFMLSYPPALSSSDSEETISNAPCGLNTSAPLFNNLTSPTTTLSTTSFPLYINTEADHQWWLFRATTDKAQPFRWTNLLPVVEQSTEGGFCVLDLSLPRSFIGREAVVQVIQQHNGGLSYQCATISFVNEMPEMMAPPCENATDLVAKITDLDDLPPSGSTGAPSNASMTASMGMGNMTATATADHHHHSATDEAGSAETAKSAGERIFASAGIAGIIALVFWVAM